MRRQARWRGLSGAVGGVALMVAAAGCQGGFPFEAVKKASAGLEVAPADGGWEPIWAPSPMAFRDGWQVPRAMTVADIKQVTHAFAEAARRVLEAGGKIVELHSAHGYLLHEFLSPLSNHRDDEYGGSFENRTRFVREVVDAVRTVWPERLPLWVRISSTDWTEGGWTVEDSVALAAQLPPGDELALAPGEGAGVDAEGHL